MSGSSEAPDGPGSLDNGQVYPPLRRLPELGVRYANLYRQVKIQETVYELLSAEYESARIQEAKEIPTVSIIDPAGYPERKSFPPRLIFMLAGTCIALAIAVFIMLLLRDWRELDIEDDLKKLAHIVATRNSASPVSEVAS
jgi:hypothetical protein